MSKLKKIMVKSGTIGQEGTFTDLIFSTSAYNIDYLSGENVNDALNNRLKVFRYPNMGSNVSTNKIINITINGYWDVAGNGTIYPTSLIRFTMLGAVGTGYQNTGARSGTVTALGATSHTFEWAEQVGQSDYTHTNLGIANIPTGSSRPSSSMTETGLTIQVTVQPHQCFIMEYKDSSNEGEGYWIEVSEVQSS